jgi:hypothetical protein
LRIDGDRRVDEDTGIERGRCGVVGRGTVEDDGSERAAARIGVVLDEKLAARAGRIETVPDVNARL